MEPHNSDKYIALQDSATGKVVYIEKNEDYINLFSTPLGREVFFDLMDKLGMFSVFVDTEERRYRRNIAAELLLMVTRGNSEPVKAAIQALLDSAARIK